jgi:hypothetical protein
LSILGFEVTIATIDGGKLPLIHILGALFFFLTLLAVTTNCTLILRDMYQWCPSIIPRFSLFIKELIAVYVILVFIYSAIGAIF